MTIWRMHISRWVPKSTNTHSKYIILYEIMWKNIAQPGRPQVTIWRMRITCWIPKITNTHSEYVKLIAFPLQQWLQERASMLPYKYIACLVSNQNSKRLTMGT